MDVIEKNVIFKHRGKVSNIRFKTKTDAAEDDEHSELAEASARREKLVEHQQVKLLKSRGLGIEIGNNIASTSSSGDNNNGEKRKDVKAAMDKQFSSHIDHGLGVNIAHEKIMDSYVNEKLGIGKETTKQEKKVNPIHELYKFPANLKIESQNEAESKSIRIREADEGPANSWSTGIAEVALPEVFRQRNIAATEAAAQQRRQEEEERDRLLQQQKGNDIYRRFQLQDEELAVYKHLLPPSGHKTIIVKDVSGTENNTPALIGSKRGVDGLKSTDDAVMKRFRQQQSNRRR